MHNTQYKIHDTNPILISVLMSWACIVDPASCIMFL